MTVLSSVDCFPTSTNETTTDQREVVKLDVGDDVKRDEVVIRSKSALTGATCLVHYHNPLN